MVNKQTFLTIYVLSTALILIPGLITDLIGVLLLLIPERVFSKTEMSKDDIAEYKASALYGGASGKVIRGNYEPAIKYYQTVQRTTQRSELKTLADGKIDECYMALKNYPKAIKYLRKANKAIQDDLSWWEDAEYFYAELIDDCDINLQICEGKKLQKKGMRMKHNCWLSCNSLKSS